MEEIYDGFEKKQISDIWSLKKTEPGAVEIQSNIVREGKSAVKITIHKGDRSDKNSERDELLERKDLWTKEGESYSYSFSIFIPKDFLIVPTRLVLAQWKQNDALDRALVDSPVLALRYVSGKLFITLQTNEKRNTLFQTKNEIRGKWLDFIFNVKFTHTASGFVRGWLNDEEIFNYEGTTAYAEKYGYPKSNYFYFKMGLYRDIMDELMTVYFDEYRKRRMLEKVYK